MEAVDPPSPEPMQPDPVTATIDLDLKRDGPPLEAGTDSLD